VAKSPFADPGVMLFNPPYGERLEIKGGRGARDALPKNNNSPEFMEFLNQFGKHLKDDFQGWQVDVLTADMGLPGQLRMKESKRTPLFNGPLECRLFRFEIKAMVLKTENK
jgi:putative N6-adenine-specific DNA methylase